MLKFKFSCGPLKTNAVLIGCPHTKKAAVIDPSYGSLKILLQTAKEHDFLIEKILLTHSHWDHFADAYGLKGATKAKLFVHLRDAENIESPGSDGIPLMVPIQPVRVDHFLEDGEKVQVGNLHIEVIHSPGHSPGGVCFYLPEEKFLFSGDTFFKGSIGNLHLPTANPEQMWQSLEKLSKLPPQTLVLPGHGEETSIGNESWLSRAREIFSE